MLTGNSKGFQRLIFDRICQIRDQEYLELEKIPSKLFDELLEKLPATDRDLLEEYDCERMGQLNRQDEILYSRGLMDGIILCRWIERIGSGEEKSIV